MSKENSYCVKKEVNVNTKCENSGRNVLRQDYHTVAEVSNLPLADWFRPPLMSY